MDRPYDENFLPVAEGLFDIPDEVYFRIKAYSSTYGKLFRQSPLHVKTAMETDDWGDTLATRQGRAFHWLALQPDLYKKWVVQDLTINKNTKAYKAWKEANAALTILSAKDLTNIQRMVAVMHSKKSVMQFLNSGWPEKVILWFEPEYGFWCKCKIDWITADGKTLIDLKKTIQATKFGFEKSIWRYQYYHQAYHYARGFTKVTGQRPDKWGWLISETDPPNECNLLMADQNEMMNAGDEVQLWYEKYAQCVATGEWPGYADEVIELGYSLDFDGDPMDDDIPF